MRAPCSVHAGELSGATHGCSEQNPRARAVVSGLGARSACSGEGGPRWSEKKTLRECSTMLAALTAFHTKPSTSVTITCCGASSWNASLAPYARLSERHTLE